MANLGNGTDKKLESEKSERSSHIIFLNNNKEDLSNIIPNDLILEFSKEYLTLDGRVEISSCLFSPIFLVIVDISVEIND
ncbi:hypothetical protein BpHYR1_028440 [Brachionus plicatilis]|uniref:Uncharacterized protein n=1 Tax=Brachionus plicatilis TaxID=10195 RepID=A0A3M7R227_BRAPC|nr:hypothetical protein BpHYR1_028440 [Brachionus plicatilis]